jgi:flagellar motility protein MotE (MotC chaperone)
MRTDPKAGAAPRLPGLEVVERLAAASTADAKVPAERRLAKYFGAMPAKDAAKILEQMDDRDVQTILSFVGDRQAAAILGSLSPQRAASIGRASLRPQPKGR